MKFNGVQADHQKSYFKNGNIFFYVKGNQKNNPVCYLKLDLMLARIVLSN